MIRHIEERVTLLEFQVDILNADVETVNAELVDQAEDLDRIEGDIAILSADQVLQDERLLELEMDSDGIKTCFTVRISKSNTAFL